MTGRRNFLAIKRNWSRYAVSIGQKGTIITKRGREIPMTITGVYDFSNR
jgi:hypothetical protein